MTLVIEALYGTGGGAPPYIPPTSRLTASIKRVAEHILAHPFTFLYAISGVTAMGISLAKGHYSIASASWKILLGSAVGAYLKPEYNLVIRNEEPQPDDIHNAIRVGLFFALSNIVVANFYENGAIPKTTILRGLFSSCINSPFLTGASIGFIVVR